MRTAPAAALSGKHRLLALVFASVTLAGAVQVRPVPNPTNVAQAASLCVDATSPTGFTGDGFKSADWAEEQIAEAPSDRFYRKDGIIVSLGMRPGVGGSCMITYKVPDGYDLHEVTAAVAQTLTATPVLGGALLRIPGKVISLRNEATPNGRYTTVDVETLP